MTPRSCIREHVGTFARPISPIATRDIEVQVEGKFQRAHFVRLTRFSLPKLEAYDAVMLER